MLEKESSVNLDQFDFKKNQVDRNIKDSFPITVFKISSVFVAAFMAFVINYYVYQSFEKEAEVFSSHNPVISIMNEAKVINYFEDDSNIVEVMKAKNGNIDYKSYIPNSDIKTKVVSRQEGFLVLELSPKDTTKKFSTSISVVSGGDIKVSHTFFNISKEKAEVLSKFFLGNKSFKKYDLNFTVYQLKNGNFTYNYSYNKKETEGALASIK